MKKGRDGQICHHMLGLSLPGEEFTYAGLLHLSVGVGSKHADQCLFHPNVSWSAYSLKWPQSQSIIANRNSPGCHLLGERSEGLYSDFHIQGHDFVRRNQLITDFDTRIADEVSDQERRSDQWVRRLEERRSSRAIAKGTECIGRGPWDTHGKSGEGGDRRRFIVRLEKRYRGGRGTEDAVRVIDADEGPVLDLE